MFTIIQVYDNKRSRITSPRMSDDQSENLDHSRACDRTRSEILLRITSRSSSESFIIPDGVAELIRQAWMDHRHHLPGQAVSSSSNSCYSTEEVVSVNMSFPIPEPYCWDESFKVFYENIDEEHRMLFRGIFNVCRTPTDPHKMERLIEVTIHHFTDEEGMMKRANYADLSTHKTMHDEFVKKLKAMHCPVSTADMHYAKEWLVNHIKGTDFKYKKML